MITNINSLQDPPITNDMIIDYYNFEESQNKNFLQINNLINVRIKASENNIFMLKVEPFITIKTLKYMIENKTGINIKNQLLVYKNIYLKSKVKLADYNIDVNDNDSYIENIYNTEKIKIYFKSYNSDKLNEMIVNPFNKISIIHHTFYKDDGKLMFKNTYLNSSRTFFDYKVSNNDIIETFKQNDIDIIKINIHYLDKIYTIDIGQFETIYNLKVKIINLINNEDSMFDVSLLNVNYQNKILKNSFKTLFDYRIVNNSDIFILNK